MPRQRPVVQPAMRRWGRRGLVAAHRLVAAPSAAGHYVGALRQFRELEREAGEPAAEMELYPQLQDATTDTDYDPHYAVQGAWVMRQLLARPVDRHVDIGSQVAYLPFFASAVPTTFIDIRPCGLRFPGLDERQGSVLDLPYDDRSLPSVSCLHVVEHIGLGRYGDPLDPAGMRKACAELARVVAPGGRLYVSTPVGRPRICFNAHRVSRPADVVAWVGLPLGGLAAVTDDGRFVDPADADDLVDADYALGLFRFDG